MHVPLIIPPFKRRKKCSRCGLLYPKKEKFCPHCNDLDDKQVHELKLKFQEEQKGNENLGKLFLYLAVIIALLVLITLFY